MENNLQLRRRHHTNKVEEKKKGDVPTLVPVRVTGAHATRGIRGRTVQSDLTLKLWPHRDFRRSAVIYTDSEVTNRGDTRKSRKVSESTLGLRGTIGLGDDGDGGSRVIAAIGAAHGIRRVRERTRRGVVEAHTVAVRGGLGGT